MTHRIAALSVLFLAAGCPEEGGGPNDRIIELEDVGEACLGEEYTPSLDIADGETATVTVTLEPCGSGCGSAVDASCTATVDGDTINVTAQASYSLPGGDVDCPAVCVVVSATCETTALAAGTYTLAYGDDSATFDVPGTDLEVCVGELYPGQ